jgi:hypothetical protein
MLCAALVLILIPIWIVDYPGMVDYPNHLTRCYILAHYHGNPLWQQRYQLDHTPIPNLMMDLIVTSLTRFLPLLVSGKLFLSLIAILYVGGCSAVGRSIAGRPNWLALPCAFTLYNKQFLYGFANYVFGVGVFLCAFAYWYRVRDKMTPLRFLICGLLSLAAYFSHLSSLVFLFIACFIITLFDYLRDRRLHEHWFKMLWLIFPAPLLFLYVSSRAQVRSVDWSYTIAEKLRALGSPLQSYNIYVDAVVAFVLLLCLVVLVKGSKIHRPVTIMAVFLVLTFLTPDGLATDRCVAERFVVPGLLIGILSIDPRRDKWRNVVIGLAVAVMLAHTVEIAANWRTIDRESRNVLAMGQVLPQRARFFALLPSDGLNVTRSWRENTAYFRMRFFHVIEFWTISKEADLSSLFANPGQQPLVNRQVYCRDPEVRPSLTLGCFAGYDYVWTYDPTPAVKGYLSSMATPASTWERAILWRVNQRPDGGSSASR